MRFVILVAVATLLAGCAADVHVVDPRTGETVTCRASMTGLNPWSQQDACVADYLAQGWNRAPQER